MQFKPSITQWVTAIIKKFFGNCVAMIQDNPFTTEALTLKFIGIASLSVLFKGWRKKSPFEVGVGGMGIIIFLFILGLYSVTAYRGLRISYILVPFLVIVLSSWVNNFNLKKSYLGLILAGVALVVIKQGFFDPTADFANIRLREKEDVIFVESLKPNKNKVFVGPFWLVLPWVYENYPVHWAFMPQNEHTFKLLDARDSVGTVLLYEHDAKIHEKTLIKVGYKKIKEAKFRSNRFFQYERSNVAN
ncbi:MAG: hypothetical protein EBR01_13070 [Proteobacteria bacterium]|nr:hypothetical protein [Pseudomonadota bacterium]